MNTQYLREIPLREVLTEELVQDDMKSRTRDTTIRQLIELLHKKKLVSDKNEACQRVIEREELASTGLGEGIAIPHARLEVGSKPVIAVGRHFSGIDFGSADGKLVRLIFLVLWAPEQAGLFNRLFAGLVAKLADPHFRARILEAKDAKAIAGELSDVHIDMTAGRATKCEADMLITLQLLETKRRAGAGGLERQIALARDELPGSLLNRFDRLIGHYGEAISDAPDGICHGCHMRLSSSFASEMERNPETVYICERCGRFLMFHITS